MPGVQKNVRLSRRALELLRALKYLLNASDNAVIEQALHAMAVEHLAGCSQRLQLCDRGLVPAEELARLRVEVAVLVAALNVETEGRWPRYRIEGNRVEREREDGSWSPFPPRPGRPARGARPAEGAGEP